MEHTKLARSIEQWQNCDPNVMAMKQSLPAIANAFIDAKHDILALKAQRDELLAALESEQEWHDRDADGAIDPEWDYEMMVAAPRRALIAKHKEASHG